MEIRSIKTEEDYRATLREIDTLMNAAPGSSEEYRLNMPATLVQAYESRYYPILPPETSEAILYGMDCQGLSPKDLERYI